jgi:hypothetical protein
MAKNFEALVVLLQEEQAVVSKTTVTNFHQFFQGHAKTSKLLRMSSFERLNWVVSLLVFVSNHVPIVPHAWKCCC